MQNLNKRWSRPKATPKCMHLHQQQAWPDMTLAGQQILATFRIILGCKWRDLACQHRFTQLQIPLEREPPTVLRCWLHHLPLLNSNFTAFFFTALGVAMALCRRTGSMAFFSNGENTLRSWQSTPTITCFGRSLNGDIGPQSRRIIRPIVDTHKRQGARCGTRQGDQKCQVTTCAFCECCGELVPFVNVVPFA